ncbi:4-(cytidine 5'-diphospho)-2-C-methyl-D-erythritol kinase [Kaarinaea lacus]
MDKWPAPAKLNLFLHITGRRSDGYHNLQTLFQFLDISDFLQFEIRQDGVIQRQTVLSNVDPEEDLTIRAAQLLQKHTGCKLGVNISIEKNLPLGGGLGGGSSDAATTLVALNTLWKLGLPQSQLMDLGRTLGADIPVFVFGQSAWAEGIGEKLQPVNVPESWYVVIYPGVTVSTAELFADPELTRDARPIKIRDYFEGGTVNVFEPIVRRRYPGVNFAFKWLSEQEIASIRPPMMTGTGSCIFAAYENQVSANAIAKLAEQQSVSGWQVFSARACNISPLATKMDCQEVRN